MAVNPGEFGDVSRETLQRLEIFESLIAKWNPRINLVSKNSLPDLRTRHITDSMQIYRMAPLAQNWADLGSGGGFPGLIVAILAADEAPELKVTLVESDTRKVAFLRTAAREVGANCTILAKRIERLDPLCQDIISARALAPLNVLLSYAERHLAFGGTALFAKGISWQKELDFARQQWRFDLDMIESQTMPGAAILKLKGVSRV